MRDLSVWHRVCWVLVFIRHTPMMGLFLYVVYVRLRGTGDDGRLVGRRTGLRVPRRCVSVVDG